MTSNATQTSHPLNIAIIGAGLGGLSAAACLLQRGHRVRVFEQSSALGEIGAGIQISANSAHVLRQLGVIDALYEVAVFPESIRFLTHDTGEVLTEVPLGMLHEQSYGERYMHVHRADLHAVLTARVRSLDANAIVLGARVRGFTESASGVTVQFEGNEDYACDVLVGADGVKSIIRDCIMGRTEAQFTGCTAWRATLPAELLGEDYMDSVCAGWLGPGAHAIVYYLRRRQTLNFVGIVENEDWREESWTIRDAWENLKQDFSAWHPDLQRLIDALPRDGCYRWALYNRPPCPGWSTARATLLGDSAHSTLPFMAQGAAMAIEDGAVLARALEEAGGIAAALQQYESARYERTAKIQTESKAMAELYHASYSWDFTSRFAERGLSRDRNAWLYGYNPLNTPLPAAAG